MGRSFSNATRLCPKFIFVIISDFGFKMVAFDPAFDPSSWAGEAQYDARNSEKN